jgi:4-hydroxybutyrate dehydrogenase
MLSSFAFPTRIVFGIGALDTLAAEFTKLRATRPLIVTDRGLLETPAFALLRDALGANAQATVFSEVHPNPIESDVTAGADAFRAGQCDSVIGFGGGSALDVAKILRAAVSPHIPDWRTFNWQMEVPPLAPFIAIPTTAGTGSEVGRSSVITFGQTKRVVFHPRLLSDLVLLEPRVTAGLPPKLTAATGVDALTHCIESFTSPTFHPLCDGIALEGARVVFDFLPRAVENGADLEARGQMQVAAAMGGIAFQKDLGAAHSLSHPLSAQFGVHHGLANGLVLPAVMRWNEARKPGLYGRLATATGQPDFIAAVESLLHRVGVTGRLRDFGVPPTALDTLAPAAFADSCHQTNPVPMTESDLRSLYEQVL